MSDINIDEILNPGNGKFRVTEDNLCFTIINGQDLSPIRVTFQNDDGCTINISDLVHDEIFFHEEDLETLIKLINDSRKHYLNNKLN